MLARRKIRSQMYFGVAMLVVIVTVLSAASFQGSLKFRDLTKTTRNRATELPLAANLSQKVSDLRSAVFLDTQYDGDDSFSGISKRASNQLNRFSVETRLQAVKEAINRYRERLESVEYSDSLIADTSRELEFIKEFEVSLQNIELILGEGNWVFHGDVSTPRLVEALEQLQTDTNQLPGFMNERMADFAQRARRDYNSWMILSAVATALAFLLIYLLYRRFDNHIFNPLDTLVDGSRHVARGNFDYRIELETHDEVSELADALNAMTSRFQAISRDLNCQVKQRTKEVVRSEKMASVGFLAAGVAHEINNPLASIAWSAESLEMRINEILNPEVEIDEEQCSSEIDEMKKYLKRIQEEAFRCKEITSGLLDFSRMGDVKKVPTDFYEAIESVVEMVKPLGKYRDRNIHFTGDRSIRVIANAQELKQVALNLITNALGSVEPGGVVSIELKHDDENAVLSVVDNGCGMTEETMNHLFEPFFTRRRDGQGTGLGLSITYQIIEDHNGRIVPFSDGPGRGASFTVSLPLVKNEEAKIAKAA
ncbi:MAG: HAMP domain-containing sensor histidine kinase [Planctomycetota bacterium]